MGWSVPVIAVGAAAPLAAASTAQPVPVNWYAQSFTDTGTPDYSNNNYTSIYVHHDDPTQPGYLKVMHWASGNTLFWRPAFAAGVAMVNPVITFTLAPGGLGAAQVLGAVPATANQFGVVLFNRFTSSPAGYYTVEQAQWQVSVSGNTVTLSYPGVVPAHSAAGWVFTSTPADGTVAAGTQYYADAALSATLA